MPRTSNVYRAFRNTPKSNPLPPLVPYKRCKCGTCRDCKENEKWDRVFAKFETKNEERGFYQCALNDF